MGGAARGGPAQRRLSGVHDYTWLARLRRHQTRAAVPRSGRRRVHSDQAQGRCHLDDDIRRLEIARAAVGTDIAIAIDANQRWDVDDAVKWIAELSRYDLAWVEEPTSPDDILGHAEIARQIHPCRWQREEHVANRVIFNKCCRLARCQSCRSTPAGRRE